MPESPLRRPAVATPLPLFRRPIRPPVPASLRAHRRTAHPPSTRETGLRLARRPRCVPVDDHPHHHRRPRVAGEFEQVEDGWLAADEVVSFEMSLSAETVSWPSGLLGVGISEVAPCGFVTL